MFVAKRTILDIHQMVAVFSTMVRLPNEIDCQKLVGMIKYLYGTKVKYGTLSYDYLKVIKWYVDASFVVHPDLYRSNYDHGTGNNAISLYET